MHKVGNEFKNMKKCEVFNVKKEISIFINYSTDLYIYE